jgi:hypothetical protein
MTWSPFFTEVTPGPTSTTMPAPSWPRMAGNRPSGSAPDSVKSSVWQMPVALTSTSTSPAFGPSSCTVMTSSGLPACTATAARTSMRAAVRLFLREGRPHVQRDQATQSVVGNLEDRRLLVLVDGDDDLRVLHAGQMLDGAGNADRDIKLRRDHLAGLADLPVVRRITGIDGSARCADGSTELVGNRQDDLLELFRRAERPAAGDDDLRRGQFRTIGEDSASLTKVERPDLRRRSFRRMPSRPRQPRRRRRCAR